VLEAVLTGPAEKKIESMATIMYSLCLEWFGPEDQRSKRETFQTNQRQKKIGKIKKDPRLLGKRWKRAKPPHEKEGLKDLRKKLRTELRNINMVERSNKQRRDRAKKRSKFVANPFKFTSDLLGGKKSGRFECPREQLEEHLKETHNGSQRRNSLGQCPQLMDQPEPSKDMNTHLE
jgi:hypothetical protein